VLTAEENIELPLTLAGRDVDRAWFDQLLSTVGISDRLTHRPSELSGGQQQRVAVAQALIHRLAVVFADEPTGNLDSVASTEVLTLLRRAAPPTTSARPSSWSRTTPARRPTPIAWSS
jgi:putative ABC transport system ATP-binding protein